MTGAPETAVFCRAALLPEGWRSDVRLAIANGRFAEIVAGTQPQPQDATCAIAVPGLPNLHCHAFQRALAGLAERRGLGTDSFWTWREAMYRFLDRMTPDDVRVIATFAYAEMLEGGFTRVGEFHYLHHDPAGMPYANPAEMAVAIAAAAAAAGIGLTLLPCFYAHAQFGGVAPTHGQRRFINGLDGFADVLEGCRHALRDLPDAVMGVAPHSLRAVTAAELDAVITLCPGGPIHIHAAEQTGEVAACVAATGMRPVRFLFAHHDVDARWCLIHATHLDDAEAAALAASTAVAGLCPLTEANLGDGIFPAASVLGAGGRFGIGTDSNILIDAAAELRQLEYGQRLTLRARNVLAAAPGASTARTLFDGALAGGAQALGAGPAGFREGAFADIVALAEDHPSLIGREGDALLDGWVFAAARGTVRSVWRGGRAVVQDGAHTHAGPIRAAYATCMRRLLT